MLFNVYFIGLITFKGIWLKDLLSGRVETSFLILALNMLSSGSTWLCFYLNGLQLMYDWESYRW